MACHVNREKELLINNNKNPTTSIQQHRATYHTFRCTEMVKKYVNELKRRTLTWPTFLLLFYSLPAFMATEFAYILLYHIITPPDVSCTSPFPELANGNWYSIIVICFNSLFLLVPVVGWLSDTIIGRHHALNVALWAGWLGTLLQSISGCLQFSSCHTVASVGKYGLSGIAILCLFVSASFSYAIILAYGMDQLIDAPSVRLRAYVYWYVWMLFVGENGLAYIPYISPNKTISLFSFTQIMTGPTLFILYTVSLCLHFKYQDCLASLKITNPYRTVYNVMKYAIRNKYPRNRSAMTYWEAKIPSRIDLAKDKFGGPFTHDSVETVKTFLRILLILTALIPFLVAGDPFINGIPNFVKQFKGGSESLNGFASFAVWFIGDDLGIVLIPLLELVLLPLFPKLEYFLMKQLKGLGIAILTLLLSIISLCVLDLIGRSIGGSRVTCYLLWTEGDGYIDVLYWVLIVTAASAGIADIISNLCILEFICSQAPRDMCGMLIGLYFFIRAVSINIASFLTIIFPHTQLANYRCTTWLSAILGGCTFFGLIIFIVAAKWYVKRVRSDDLNLRIAIEEHFERQLIRKADFINKTHKESMIT